MLQVVPRIIQSTETYIGILQIDAKWIYPQGDINNQFPLPLHDSFAFALDKDHVRYYQFSKTYRVVKQQCEGVDNLDK